MIALLKNSFPRLKEIFSNWSRHEAPRLGAALAFYTILSLSPLLLLTIAIAAFFFDRSTAMRQITDQIQSLVGSVGAQVIQTAVESGRKTQSAGAASAISALVLLFGASGVFGELRSALNKIWEVEPDTRGGLWSMLRERLFSFGMVLSVGFLLTTALILSAGLMAVSTFLGGVVPIPPVLAAVGEFIISLLGISVVFALIFRYVPAAKVAWRPAWVGGIFTSVLFAVGKYVIGIYLAKAAPGSAYGAAGSIVVIIVWVYYTAQIVFLGAEFTHVYAREGTLGRTYSAAAPDRSHSTRPEPVG